MNEAPLIAFTDSEMKYVECFRSTTSKLICMVMNVFLWESEIIPHELFWKRRYCTRYLEKEARDWEVSAKQRSNRGIVCKFPIGFNLSEPVQSLQKGKGIVLL